MLAIFARRTWCQLFAAQVVALVGTGLMTVALGLLAFELAGDHASALAPHDPHLPETGPRRAHPFVIGGRHHA
jgi:hypothetical protein